MKWTDINDIAIELTDTYPDKDPLILQNTIQTHLQ